MDSFLAKQAHLLGPIWWASCLIVVVSIGIGNIILEGSLLLLGLVQLAWPYAVGQMASKRGHNIYKKIFCSALVGFALYAIVVIDPPRNTMLLDYLEAYIVLSVVGAYLLFCIRLARIASDKRIRSSYSR